MGLCLAVSPSHPGSARAAFVEPGAPRFLEHHAVQAAGHLYEYHPFILAEGLFHPLGPQSGQDHRRPRRHAVPAGDRFAFGIGPAASLLAGTQEPQ